jgi:hypothetical protein
MEPRDPFADLLTAPTEGGPAPPSKVALAYTHDALVDEILRDPTATKADLARRFSRSPSWIYAITSSDAFKARLAARREELIDPHLVASVEEKLEAVAQAALDVLLESPNMSVEQAISALREARQGLGMGVRPTGPVVNNFVAVVPPKATSFEEWASQHGPGDRREQSSSREQGPRVTFEGEAENAGSTV